MSITGAVYDLSEPAQPYIGRKGPGGLIVEDEYGNPIAQRDDEPQRQGDRDE